MLLTGAHERVRTGNSPAPVLVRRRMAARSREAWILLGGLDGALYQAGIIDAVIERIARPHVVFAGGASVLDAVLALDGRALAFRIGWERMRAAHVLGTVALEHAPLARLMRGRLRRNGDGNGTGDGSFVAFEAMRATPDGGAPELRVLRDGVFVDPHAGSDAASSELVAASLREQPAAKEVAAAIHKSIELGARRVLLLGADERVAESHEVARAADDAHAAAIDLVVLALERGERPGTLGYVLPGLGRADRLIESGRDAARRWLREEARDPLAV
jgi:hypothetical protein